MSDFISQDPRFDRIIEAIAQIGAGNFDVELPPVEQGDGVDAISLGLQMLCEEIQASIQQKIAAEHLSNVRSRFLATMSHEIRTPLNGILGMLDMLEDTVQTAGQREYTAIMRRSSVHLLNIVNDILDFSKAETAELELYLAPERLRQVLEGALESFRARALESGLRLSMQLPASADRWYAMDALRLSQVLINLLGNAMRFTESGEVGIRVEVEGENSDGAQLLRFEVHDTGQGMDRDTLKRVFDAFYQADQSRNAQRSGTGLGLAISRRLVAAMGGSLEARSMVGQGSTFWFVAPFAPAAPVQKISQSLPEVQTVDVSHLRVLLVEDNPVNRMIAEASLQRHGLQPVMAHDGAQAIERALAQPFELILMDCMMPGIDGFEATRAIRRAALARQPVICALSAAVTTEERTACIEAGMDEHLAKPLERERLHDLLIRVGRGELRVGQLGPGATP